jgi:hypothetical protein
MTTAAKERFLKDVAKHQMQILKDDGLYRHIRFRRPNEGTYYFDLITWPGHLCIVGDMQDYLFARNPDMFEFFEEEKCGFDSRYIINPQYWHEKVLASPDRVGVKEFSQKKFEEAVRHHFDSYIEGRILPSEEIDELWSEIQSEVLGNEEHEGEARRRADDFKWKNFTFGDFWETDLTDFTVHYIWCCYAIVWGIKQYKAHKKTEAENGL